MKKANQRRLVLNVRKDCEMCLVDVSRRRDCSYKGQTSSMLAMKEGRITIPPRAEIARFAGRYLMTGGISLGTICTLHVVRQLGYTSLDAGNTRFNGWNIVLV